MKKFSYAKFSPAGNTTIFLTGKCPEHLRPHYCHEAMSHEGIFAEQAAFADIRKKHFTMAGNEFCINACRAFGAFLDLKNRQNLPAREYIASIGTFGEICLSVNGKIPLWDVSLFFQPSILEIKKTDCGHHLVALTGISHLLIECSQFPEHGSAVPLACGLLKKNHINPAPAAGVIWWKKTKNCLEILPFVQVEKAGTAMLESSCGSGSLALAYVLEKNCSILQPSGYSLSIAVNSKTASVSGPVALSGKGHIWLKYAPVL